MIYPNQNQILLPGMCKHTRNWTRLLLSQTREGQTSGIIAAVAGKIFDFKQQQEQGVKQLSSQSCEIVTTDAFEETLPPRRDAAALRRVLAAAEVRFTS